MQVMEERFGPFGKLQSLGNGFKNMFVKPLEQRDPLQKTLGKINLSPHCLLCNCRYLRADTGFQSKFIDYF